MNKLPIAALAAVLFFQVFLSGTEVSIDTVVRDPQKYQYQFLTVRGIAVQVMPAGEKDFYFYTLRDSSGGELKVRAEKKGCRKGKRYRVNGRLRIDSLTNQIYLVEEDVLQAGGAILPARTLDSRQPAVQVTKPDVLPAEPAPAPVFSGGDVVFTPGGGEHVLPLQVEILASPVTDQYGNSVASEIYYTTDGTEPSRSSLKYEPGLKIAAEGDHLLKARAFARSGKYEGRTGSALLTVKAPAPPPVVQPPPPPPRVEPPQKRTYRIMEGEARIYYQNSRNQNDRQLLNIKRSGRSDVEGARVEASLNVNVRGSESSLFEQSKLAGLRGLCEVFVDDIPVIRIRMSSGRMDRAILSGLLDNVLDAAFEGTPDTPDKDFAPGNPVAEWSNSLQINGRSGRVIVRFVFRESSDTLKYAVIVEI